MNRDKLPKVAQKNTCIPCDYTCSNTKDYMKHLSTAKHQKKNLLEHLEQNRTEKLLKVAKKNTCNTCDLCDYSTIKKSSYDKHLLSNKHINKLIPNNLGKNDGFICDNCNKAYNARNSLWYHKKKCLVSEESISDPSANEIKLLTNLVIELVKSNTEIVKSNNDLQKQSTEIQKQVVDVCQKIQPTTNTNSHNTNTNSHNKTFNLQFFLNEECKDAMNMSEFIKSIEVKLSDLDNIGKLGYVEGMSDIIIKQLKDTDVNKRPVHCSDAKRETLYVKEENKWEKDTEQMARAVPGVDKKNYKLLANWKDMNPTIIQIDADNYVKVVGEVMDGDEENVTKVIKKVAKQVVIDK